MNTENYKYQFDTECSVAIAQLLSETIYGTKGGLLLQHKDIARKLQSIKGAQFHTLWEGNELCAVAVYCQRKVFVKSLNKYLDAFYIRYFSVNPIFQNKGLGKLLTQKVETHYRNTIKEPTIFYAYIEQKNLKSQSVSNHFEPKKNGCIFTCLF